MKIFQGQRPDVTPAQVIALLLAGVPVIATVLHSFGVYDMSPEQQEALKDTLEWAGILAVGLFGADAGLRAARSHSSARVRVAELPGASAVAPLPPPLDVDVALELPSDHEEFAAAAPDDELDGRHDLKPASPGDDEEFAGFEPDDDSGPDSRLQAVAPEEDLL